MKTQKMAFAAVLIRVVLYDKSDGHGTTTYTGNQKQKPISKWKRTDMSLIIRIDFGFERII